MKISVETNIDDKVAAPALDRLLTRVVAVLEKGTGLKFDVKANGNTVRLAHKAKLLRRQASRAEAVAYDASESSYTVLVEDHNKQVISEKNYSGGDELSYESNLTAAEKMAGDAAAELGVDPRYVYHDSAILAPEREDANRPHP